MGAALGAAAGAVGGATRAAPEFDVAVARAMAKAPRSATRRPGTSAARRVPPRRELPSEPERMVARGAAAPGAAPSEPGLRPRPRRAPRFRFHRRGGARRWLSRGGGLRSPSPRSRRRWCWCGRTSRRRGRDQRRRADGEPSADADADRRRQCRPRSRAWSSGSRTSAIAPRGSRSPAATCGSSPRAVPDAHRRGDGRGARQAPEGRQRLVGDRRNRKVWVAVGTGRKVLRLDGRTGKVRAEDPGRAAAARDQPRRRLGRHELPRASRERCFATTGSPELKDTTCPKAWARWSRPTTALWVVRRDTHEARAHRLRQPTAGRLAEMSGRVRSIREADGSCGSCSRTRTRSSRSRRAAAAVHRLRRPQPHAGARRRRRVLVASRNDQSVLVLDPETMLP